MHRLLYISESQPLVVTENRFIVNVWESFSSAQKPIETAVVGVFFEVVKVGVTVWIGARLACQVVIKFLFGLG